MVALTPGAQAALRQAIAAGFLPLDGNSVPDLDLMERLCSTSSIGSTGALIPAAPAVALPVQPAPVVPAAPAHKATLLLAGSATVAALAPSLPPLATFQLPAPPQQAAAASSVAGGTPSAAAAQVPSTSAADSAESRPPEALQPFSAPKRVPAAAVIIAAPPAAPARELATSTHALAHAVPAAAVAAAAAGGLDAPADDARMKSRAIQARYRQRQKERRLQLIQSYQETTAELEEARRLNKELRFASQVMEAVVGSREGSLAILQAARAESDGGSSDESGGEDGSNCRALARLAPPRTAALAQPAALPGQLSSQTAADLVRNLLSLPFDRRAELCCDILVRHEPSRQTVECWTLAQAEQQLGGCEDMEMRLRRELGRHLKDASPQLLEAVLNMSQRQLLEDWADFTDVAAQAVAAMDAGQVAEGDVYERIRSGYLYHVMINSLLINNRPEWCRWRLSHTMLPGESEAEAAVRWQQVAVKLGITHSQALRIQRAYQDYCARLSDLAAESAIALQALEEAKQALAGDQLLELGAPLGTSMSRYLALVQATGVLAHQPNEAVITLLEFSASLTRVLTRIQRARMVALCKPLLPDFVLIATGAMRHHGVVPRALSSPAAPPMHGSVVPVVHPLAAHA